MSAAYVDLLKTLYYDQTASVIAGAKSRDFSVWRGVKQGDPISALLFIAVMEAIFRNLKKKLHKANLRRRGGYFGMVIDGTLVKPSFTSLLDWFQSKSVRNFRWFRQLFA